MQIQAAITASKLNNQKKKPSPGLPQKDCRSSNDIVATEEATGMGDTERAEALDESEDAATTNRQSTDKQGRPHHSEYAKRHPGNANAGLPAQQSIAGRARSGDKG